MALVGFAYGLLLLLLYRYFIYPAFFSPLSKIPNAHFTSPFSNAWILWQRYRGRQNRAIHDAHIRLGPVVRLGLTELSVNSPKYVRAVYGDGCDRHEWYSRKFEKYGVQNMFSMTLRKSHSERRRVLGNVYSKSALYTTLEIQKFSEVLLLERLFPIIEEAAWKQTPLDVLELSLSISIDFATAYLFGIQNSTNFLQDVVTRKRWLHAHDRSKEQSFLAVEFPGMTSVIESLRISIQSPETALSSKEVQDLCLQMIQKVESSSFSSSEVASMHESMKWTKPVVYEQLLRQLQPVFDRKAPVPSPDTASQLRLTIASELMDHIIAGTETNGWTLTYIMYELSLHPELQSSLRSELFSLPSPMVYTKTSFPSQTPSANADLPSPRTLDSLPILDAIVLETLRRYPSVPGAQPRTSRTHISLDRYADIPPGIRVSAQAYSLHRNANVFPDPESWSPMRWLTCDKEARENMMRWFWAFGSGGRMCIGNHFALLELKLLVGAIYTNYTTKIVDDEGIEQKDTYTSGPRGNKLILEFQKV